MFERVVVAVDGSEQSVAAFSFATALAQHSGGTVTAVRVLTSPYEILTSAPEPVPGLERVIELREREAAEELAALAASAPDGVRVETQVLHGDPGPTLIDALAEVDADLVVAGTHGVGFSRFLLGRVSQQLLERAPCDLLLFRWASAPTPPPTVIAALDDSEHAERALRTAEGLALALSTTLVLTHVANYHVPLAYEPGSSVRQAVREHGERVLHDARGRVTAPLEHVVEELREGSPRSELLAVCEERAPAIAVVASRGTRGFHGLLVGSTARDVVNYAGCPVLVVRVPSG